MTAKYAYTLHSIIGKTEIEPKTVALFDEDTFNDLLKVKAVRPATEDEIAAYKLIHPEAEEEPATPAKKPAAKKTAAKKPAAKKPVAQDTVAASTGEDSVEGSTGEDTAAAPAGEDTAAAPAGQDLLG